MKFNIFAFLFILFYSNTVFSQLKVVDKVENNLSILFAETVNEIRADELIDSKVKISFCTGANKRENGYIYLKSITEFEELSGYIMDLFDKNKDDAIVIDMGDSQLSVFYEKMVWGSGLVYLVHSYKNALYATRTSTSLSKKDVKKLFNR